VDKNGRDSTLSQTDRTLIQKFQSLLGARCGTNGRNPEDGRDFKILSIVQQVMRIALLFPVLERGIFLSSCKGAWGR
jgi:hypothetical protein